MVRCASKSVLLMGAALVGGILFTFSEGFASSAGHHHPPEAKIESRDATHVTATAAEMASQYSAAMHAMHGPMLEGINHSDPDVAFIAGMIPHHQGAVDMSEIVLKYGRDEQVKKLARKIISEQKREIVEMQSWLAAQDAERH